jgi:hypothetical protein
MCTETYFPYSCENNIGVERQNLIKKKKNVKEEMFRQNIIKKETIPFTNVFEKKTIAKNARNSCEFIALQWPYCDLRQKNMNRICVVYCDFCRKYLFFSANNKYKLLIMSSVQT